MISERDVRHGYFLSEMAPGIFLLLTKKQNKRKIWIILKSKQVGYIYIYIAYPIIIINVTIIKRLWVVRFGIWKWTCSFFSFQPQIFCVKLIRQKCLIIVTIIFHILWYKNDVN